PLHAFRIHYPYTTLFRSADLERLREEVREAVAHGMRPTPRGESADARRVKEFEKELRRKEKALAETAAILVLRKKLSAFFSAGEDRKSTRLNSSHVKISY